MSVGRIGVFARLWEPGLGDLVQRNIFLHLLRRAHPHAAVTHVLNRTATVRFAAFLAHHSAATDVLACPDFGADPADPPESWAPTLAAITARGFGLCVVDPDSRGLGGAEAHRCGIPVRIGFEVGHTGAAALTAALRIPRPVFGAPDLLDFATALGAALGLPPGRAADLLPPLRYRPVPTPGIAQPLLALHPGGAPHWNRRWPRDHYVELVREVAGSIGSVLLVGSGAEAAELADLATDIDRRAGGAPVLVSAGESLDRLISLLARARVLVGSDSAPAHIAATLQVPTVVLYGPTPTEFMWSRIYPRHHGVNLRYACQQVRNLPRGPGTAVMPCEHRCTYPYLGPEGPYPRCLSDIAVDRVVPAVRHHLAGRPVAPAAEPGVAR